MKKLEIKYVSKRLVSRKSKSAFKSAAKKALETNGYIIIEKDGWLVKEYSDGQVEQLEQIHPDISLDDLILD